LLKFIIYLLTLLFKLAIHYCSDCVKFLSEIKESVVP